MAKRLFTVEEFHRMVDAGILLEGERVELIDGEIVEMGPIGSRHAACLARLTAALSRCIGSRVILRVQSPIGLSDRAEPQPDLALLHPRADVYAQAHPEPAEVLLAIESPTPPLCTTGPSRCRSTLERESAKSGR